MIIYNMPIVSVYVTDELYEKMKRHPEINWSAVARKAFEEIVKKIEGRGSYEIRSF